MLLSRETLAQRKMVQSKEEPVAKLKLSDFTDDDVLTGEQMQSIFGVSRTTVWRWTKAGLASPIDLGGTLRFRVSDIKAAVRGLPIKTSNPGPRRKLRATV